MAGSSTYDDRRSTYRANGISRRSRESICGPVEQIHGADASPMPHQLSHSCRSRTTSYLLRTTFRDFSSLNASLLVTPRRYPKNHQCHTSYLTRAQVVLPPTYFVLRCEASRPSPLVFSSHPTHFRSAGFSSTRTQATLDGGCQHCCAMLRTAPRKTLAGPAMSHDEQEPRVRIYELVRRSRHGSEFDEEPDPTSPPRR